MYRRILALYVYDNQHELVETTTKLLWNRNVDIDAICISTYRFIKGRKSSWPWIVCILSFLITILRIPKVQGITKRMFGNHIFYKLIDKYDFVDFQSFPSSQFDLAEYCLSKKKEYMIGFWGSDILRLNEDGIKCLRKYLDKSKFIRVNKAMADKICSYYKDQLGINYSMKFRGGIDGIINGNKDFELLNIIEENDIKCVEPLIKKGNTNKLLVTIGYNGSPAQNHDRIVRLFTNLSTPSKERIHLVLPMTYGASIDYLNKIKTILSNIGITYTILDKFLSNKEVCVLRHITDVFVMMQDTDAFAASVRSHLYCQNVCLIADWLDYPIDDKGVYYEKVNWKNFLDTFTRVLNDYDAHKAKCLPNKERMLPFMTWDRYIDYMCNLYKY